MKGSWSWAARVWLALLFWHTTHALWVPRLIKPIILFFTWHTSRPTRENSLANARRLLGPESTLAQQKSLARAVVARFFDIVVDFGASRGLTIEQLNARVEKVDGVDRYERARALKRGAILVTAHLGPFETALANLRTRESKVHVVFRRDRDAIFEKLRADHRRSLGAIEARPDEGLKVWFGLRDALRNDEVVLIQGDRTMPGQRGVPMPFLDGHIDIPDGPVKLALAAEAPIIPVFATFTPVGRVHLHIDEPMLVISDREPRSAAPEGLDVLSPDEALRRIADSIAGIVQRYPDQWLRLDKAWIEDRDAPTA